MCRIYKISKPSRHKHTVPRPLYSIRLPRKRQTCEYWLMAMLQHTSASQGQVVWQVVAANQPYQTFSTPQSLVTLAPGLQLDECNCRMHACENHFSATWRFGKFNFEFLSLKCSMNMLTIWNIWSFPRNAKYRPGFPVASNPKQFR